MPLSRGQVSTGLVGFCLEPDVCRGAVFAPQLSKEGLLVSITCSSSSLQYTPFSWGPLLAFKDPLFQKCSPISDWVRGPL